MPKKKIAKKEEPKIKLTLALGALHYKAQEENFEKAVSKIKQDSKGMIKTWGVLTLEKDGKKAEVRWIPIRIKRAFANVVGQHLLEKFLTLKLK